jgi:S-DNA-T family DNA segregation ATPase FtsK/SpoIIIE
MGAPAADNKEYRLPEMDLLVESKVTASMSNAYFENMSQTLENALGQFGVSAKVVEVCPGPVVTRYELQPAPGVKVNRIISLADDIALAMKAEHVRIEAPIPGKGAVGIEIPNAEKQVVVLRELLSNPAFGESPSVLTFAIGKDIGGQHIFARLESMPHLLVAGATGSGKSACVNSIICSLLYRATPREVRFLMIDPKRVELTMYNAIPHLKSPVITDPQAAAGALKLLVKEMEDRYKLFATAGVRDILAYNQQVAQARAAAAEAENGGGSTPGHMPYIIVFIDEFADLMMVAANEVENSVTRLAQMARGVGIHLVLATQRPSVDVITGVIKANFPSRIAFQVSSKVDSRTILDANGADALLGRGDMLYSPASASKALRVQGVFVTTPEVERIATFWKEQGAPVFDPAFSDSKLKSSGKAEGEDGEEDELFSEAVSWVVRAKQASTSLLQRRLKIGYSRAARLLDLMEERGVVGPPEGSKPRKVLVSSDSISDSDDSLPMEPNV